jgi:hypothetical protein
MLRNYHQYCVMKIIICTIAVLSTLTTGFSQYYTSGYTTRSGTYVQGHYRSNPDGNINNNWSTRGNYNPYTGAAGTRNPNYNTGYGYGGYGGSTRGSSYYSIYGR